MTHKINHLSEPTRRGPKQICDCGRCKTCLSRIRVQRYRERRRAEYEEFHNEVAATERQNDNK